MASQSLPSEFFKRRLHSIMGFFLVLFLLEHLLTNSQAALLIGDDGNGFVKAVNFISGLPYLPMIEIFLLGVPFAIHMGLGVKYLLSAESNLFMGGGSKPIMGKYERNWAYSLQRITSWLLVFMVIAHVYQNRFALYPAHSGSGANKQYMVKVSFDKGLYTLSQRLAVTVFDAARIAEQEKRLARMEESLQGTPELSSSYNERDARFLERRQQVEAFKGWLAALKAKPLHEGELIVMAESAGKAMLFTVRDTFKSLPMAMFYSLFVLLACYHASNGLWTFLLSWGIVLGEARQKKALVFCKLLNVFLLFLGLASIWASYWINLYQ